MLALKAVQRMPKSVRVEWEDGLMASFNYVWLRDNCPRRPSLVHLDLDLKPQTIKCSKESLRLVWPPFMNTDYSSMFLRENAPSLANPSIHSHNGSQHNNQINSQRLAAWQVVPTSAPIDPKLVIGQTFWESGAQEPGTAWPWMSTVPAVCAVESANGEPAKLSLVNQQQAYELMSQRHPDEFSFLMRCELEYSSEGLLRARHPLCSRLPNGAILPGVFNNMSRSATITVQPIEGLYDCLQKLGRIFAEVATSIELQPGECLLVDNSSTLLGAPAQSNRLLILRMLRYLPH
jgi:alpha-ketoglutarate-dependent taurine dioxygenase